MQTNADAGNIEIFPHRILSKLQGRLYFSAVPLYAFIAFFKRNKRVLNLHDFVFVFVVLFACLLYEGVHKVDCGRHLCCHPTVSFSLYAHDKCNCSVAVHGVIVLLRCKLVRVFILGGLQHQHGWVLDIWRHAVIVSRFCHVVRATSDCGRPFAREK